MANTLMAVAKRHANRKPTWEMALRYPDQGTWTEDEYLSLPGNQLVEFTDGFVEVLPMPTEYHQEVVLNFAGLLQAFVRSKNLGKVLAAPMPVKVDQKKYREPDVIFKRKSKLPAKPRETTFWDGADLVIEVMSDGAENRNRDLVKKRAAYAAAGIMEYWIVDLENAEVIVLKLKAGKYVTHGVFRRGDQIRSALLADLVLAVDDVL